MQVYNQRQIAKKKLFDLRQQLKNLKEEMNKQPSKKKKQKRSRAPSTEGDDDDVQVIGGCLSSSAISRKTGEELLLKSRDEMDELAFRRWKQS